MSRQVTRLAMERELFRLELAATKADAAITNAQNHIYLLQERIRRIEGYSYDNKAAGIRGILRLMEAAGAVGYVAEGGGIVDWVMPDGSRKSAKVEP